MFLQRQTQKENIIVFTMIAQVIIQLMLALQTFGSPVDLLSTLPEEPIDPPNGDQLETFNDDEFDDNDEHIASS